MKKEYHILFPFSQVKQNSRIILYGAGDVGQTFYWQIKGSGYCSVIGWIDKSWDGIVIPMPMMQKKDLKNVSYDYVIIAVKSEKASSEIREELLLEGVDKAKIIAATGCETEYSLCGLNETAGVPFWKTLAGKIGVVIPTEVDDISLLEKNGGMTASSERKVNIGLSSTGFISAVMAEMIRKRISGARLVAVSSRDGDKASSFAKEHGFERAYGSLDAMLGDSDVGLVHISSPAALHYSQTMAALSAGKHVLCEKPFALNARQAMEMIALSEKKNLLLSDGIWTKCLPMAGKIKEICQSGRVGKIFAISADCYYPAITSSRINNYELGGGAMLELGLYLLSFVSLVFGLCPDEVRAFGIVNENGVDVQDEVVLRFGERVAVLNFGLRGFSGRKGFIYGDAGYIEIHDSNQYRKIIVYDKQGDIAETYDSESGYQYEVLSCIEAMKAGKFETVEQPHQDTLDILRIADEIRRQIGVRYECEKM